MWTKPHSYKSYKEKKRWGEHKTGLHVSWPSRGLPSRRRPLCLRGLAAGAGCGHGAAAQPRHEAACLVARLSRFWWNQGVVRMSGGVLVTHKNQRFKNAQAPSQLLSFPLQKWQI